MCLSSGFISQVDVYGRRSHAGYQRAAVREASQHGVFSRQPSLTRYQGGKYKNRVHAAYAVVHHAKSVDAPAKIHILIHLAIS